VTDHKETTEEDHQVVQVLVGLRAPDRLEVSVMMVIRPEAVMELPLELTDVLEEPHPLNQQPISGRRRLR
jgi:hypothetical protein